MIINKINKYIKQKYIITNKLKTLNLIHVKNIKGNKLQWKIIILINNKNKYIKYKWYKI